MKKKSLNRLKLNKSSISHLQIVDSLKGGMTGDFRCDLGTYGSHYICRPTAACPSDNCPGSYFCHTGAGDSDCDCDTGFNCYPSPPTEDGIYVPI